MFLHVKTMSIVWILLFVIFPQVLLAQQEQEDSVSINRPRSRVQQPWVQINTDLVRCYCNFPSCVATGYMCKSSSGGCFSDFSESSRTSGYRGRHGCIEELSDDEISHCPISDKDGQIHKKGKEHPSSLLVCCTNHMCNHVDNPLTKILLNNTLGEGSENKFHHQAQETFLYSNSEVWFRAATIAVPICGAVILFALIALAVKILKSENQNAMMHDKLGPAMYMVPSEQKTDKWHDNPYKPCTIKRPYYTQAHPSAFVVRPDEEDSYSRQVHIPLLVTNEIRDFNTTNSSTASSVNGATPFSVNGTTPFSVNSTSSSTVNESKNDANAKLNLMQCESNSSRSIILEIGKSTPDYSLAVNMNVHHDEKFCNSEKTFMS